jgi:DNA-binding response OmpR family regulator
MDRMRALIADDDRTTRVLLSRTLERWGFETVVANDGESAWSVLTSATPPSIAIVDWMMPGLDGLEICRRLHDEPDHPPVYVILLTSRSTRHDVVAGLNAGADDYLTKPFDHDELRARVQAGVRIVTLQDRLAEQVRQLQAALASVKQLRGLLPICSYCKRVRNDHNYWEQVESFVTEHSDAKFSHGICPSCLTIARAGWRRETA